MPPKKKISVDSAVLNKHSAGTLRVYSSSDNALADYLSDVCGEEYLDDNKILIRPISWAELKSYLDFVLGEGDVGIVEDDTVLFPEAEKTTKSDNYFKQILGAVNRLHEASNLQVTNEVSTQFGNFLRGYSRTIAEMRESGLLPARAGGDFIPWEMYEQLCMFFYKEQDMENVLYCHMLCNTGTRAENCANANQSHIDRDEDMMTIAVPHTKVRV